MLYPIALTLHSIVRWLIIVAALLAIIRAVNGLSFKRGWTGMDNRVGMWFTTLMDIQLLIGIILYFFLSPLTMSALQNFGGVMGDTTVRFFAAEHAVVMFIAVILAHVGRSLARKADNSAGKHRRTIIWFSLALVLVLLAIPWPFLEYGRPLLSFGF
jgi:hypothetical protein